MSRVALTALVLFSFGLVAATATAQETQTLTVKNGTVVVNGQVLAEDETPESLKHGAADVFVTFTGNQSAIVQIDGKFFRLKTGGLELVDPKDIDPHERPIVVLDGSGGANVFAYGFSGDGGLGRQNAEASRVISEAFREQAVRFEELRDQMKEQQLAEGERIATEMSREARRTADIVAQAPVVDTRNYFEGVKVKDAGLYQQMIEESALEAEIYSLAAQVRKAPKGPDRDAAVEKLRAQLEIAFELKQQNRRREVKQLEDQLDQLDANVERRESMKSEIVSRRLNQLLGSDSYDW